MKPITHFISFGTLKHGHKMVMAHERWTKQIEHLKSVGLVKNGKIYSEDDLDETWWNRFGKYVSDHGYTYWSWKSYIINQLFEKMQYGDSLCYFDGGCVFPEDNDQLLVLTEEIQKVIDQLKENEFDVALTKGRGGTPCGYITRKEVLDKFELSQNQDFLFKFPHWQAGLIIIVKTPKTEKLIHDWSQFIFSNYETCIRFPFNDKKNQIPGFIHNGSDQAIFQCLLYKGQYGVIDVSKLLNPYIIRSRA